MTSTTLVGTDARAAAVLPPRGMLRSLRVRNYRIHSTANLVSITGTWMQVVAQNWMVLELTGSTTALGASVGLQALPTVVLSMWGGVLADRVDRRRFLLGLQVAQAMLATVLGVIALRGPGSVAPLYVLALLTGALTAVEGPASASFTAELVPRPLLSNAIAIGSAISSTGRVLGMALAGVAVSVVGPAPVFFANGASFFAVVAGLSLLRTAEMEPAPRVPRARGQLREGVGFVLGRRELLSLFALAWFLSAFGRNFQVTMAAMTAGPLGTGASGYGQASMVFAVGAFAGAFVAAAAGTMTRRLLVGAALVTALGQGLAGLAPGMSTFLVAIAPAAVGAVVIDTAIAALAQLGARDEIRGRVLAVLGVVTTSATVVGGPLLGAVADRFGARGSLVVGGAVAGLATLVAARAFARASGRSAVGALRGAIACGHGPAPHGTPRRCRRCQLRARVGGRQGARRGGGPGGDLRPGRVAAR